MNLLYSCHFNLATSHRPVTKIITRFRALAVGEGFWYYSAVFEKSKTPNNDRKNPGPQRNRPRFILFRFAALLIVLLSLILLELILRLFVPAPATNMDDPYISFAGLRPLYVLDSTGSRFETSRQRLAAFRPQSFAAEKLSNSFRIFCLGGSTVQGRPYSVETSFTTWLKFNLRAANPDIDYEVINCGGISYASYRLVPIMAELLTHKPDLFIIYTGHNEFLEDRTYKRLKKIPRPLLRLHHVLLNLRSYSLANSCLSRRSSKTDSSKTVLPVEAQAILDFEDGLEAYHRDLAWRQDTIEHFHHNLETMVRMSHDAGVPVILANPVSNLKDCPPFKSQFRENLSEKQIQQIAELRHRAGQLSWDDTYAKIELLEQAAAIDNQHAELLYLLGKCYSRIGRFDQAKKWFVEAKDQDICPLRILEPMNRAILDVAERYNVPLVDVKALIEQRTEDSIPGDEWLLDHVHPGIVGHQLIADELFRSMEKMQLIGTPKNWRTTRDELWQSRLSSLDEEYYRRGANRLERLKRWSRGRTPKE